jgi:hypothetical protein
MIVAVIISLVGWFVFHSNIALLVGFGVYVIVTIKERNNLNRNAKYTESILLVIGLVLAVATNTPFYITPIIIIMIYQAILTIIVPLLAFIMFSDRK